MTFGPSEASGFLRKWAEANDVQLSELGWEQMKTLVHRSARVFAEHPERARPPPKTDRQVAAATSHKLTVTHGVLSEIGLRVI